MNQTEPVDARRSGRRIQVSLAAGAALTLAAIGWLATAGLAHSGDDYLLGPIRVSVSTEIVVLALVVALFLVSVARAVRRGSAWTDNGISIDSAVILAAVSLVTSLLWRVVTSPGGGANIGGAITVLVWPPVVLILLAVVAVTESGRNGTAIGRAGYIFAALAGLGWVVTLIVATG